MFKNCHNNFLKLQKKKNHKQKAKENELLPGRITKLCYISDPESQSLVDKLDFAFYNLIWLT